VAVRTISGKETLMIRTRIYDAIEEFVAELLHADQLVEGAGRTDRRSRS
jgi:hypothetical protein